MASKIKEMEKVQVEKKNVYKKASTSQVQLVEVKAFKNAEVDARADEEIKPKIMRTT